MGYPRCRVDFARPLVFAALLLAAFGARAASAASAVLVWTSPADNLLTRVTYYDLRLSTRAIVGTDTLGWWNAATKISMTGRVPAPPGTTETLLLGGLLNGARYYAILKSADNWKNWSGYSNVAAFTGVTSVTGVAEGDPAPAVVLGSPRPTPTSGRAEVNLDLRQTTDVDAAIFDAQGRRVRTLERGTLAAGTHVLRWDGTLEVGGDAASGVYWIRVGAGAIDKRVKLVVLR